MNNVRGQQRGPIVYRPWSILSCAYGPTCVFYPNDWIARNKDKTFTDTKGRRYICQENGSLRRLNKK